MIKKTIAAAAAIGVALTAFAGIADARPGKPGDLNIVEIAAGNSNFSTLVSAVVAADLVDALSDPDARYTVFAPTNAAFEKVADELGLTVGALVDYLVDEDLLASVLLYHVAEGRRFSNSVVGRNDKSIQTLLGAPLVVTPSGQVVDAAPSTSNASIGPANINASNGVIHVIDNVLVPLPL
jgi:uncharacterized surface protein with fasciclin (FAS1) repeats